MKIAKISDFKNYIKEKKELKQTTDTPSVLKFAFFDSIDFVNAAAWNKVVPNDRALMRAPYLSAVEQSSADTKHRYVLMYKDGNPVAAAVFNIIEIGGEDFGSVAQEETSKRKRVVNKIKDRAVLRLLICGNVHLSGEHGFYYRDIAAEQAYHALNEAIYKIKQAESHNGSIHMQLVKDFYENEFDAAEHLVNHKYRKFEVDPNMIVPIKSSWKSFDDYLGEMKAKYRKSAKSAIKKGKNLERRAFTSEDIEQNRERLIELYENVSEKAKFRIVKIPPEYFFHLKQNLGEEFEFIGYYLEDILVGFTCSILWGNNLEGHTIGLDYEYNSKNAVYQNILYDDIKWAIEKGLKSVIYGRTALEIKSGVGAEPAPMRCFMRHPNSISNKLIKPVFRHIKTSNWTQRSPFK